MIYSPTQQSWNAQDYAIHSQAQLKWAMELIQTLDLQSDQSLLDMGCGDGKITAYLASLLPQGYVVGIDASENMINFAQQTYPFSQYFNLKFYQRDVRSFQLNQKFDFAFSNAVLHWVDDHVAVLKCLHAHLNPGGKILFQMGGKGNTEQLLIVVEEVIKSSEWKEYFEGFMCPYYFYDVAHYRQWLPENGFIPIKVELIPKDMQHQGKEGLKNWMRTTWFPYTDRLPEQLREKFLNTIVTNYTQIVPIDPQGFTHVKMMRLQVKAQVDS